MQITLLLRLTRLVSLPPLAKMVCSPQEETASSAVPDLPKNQRLADPLFATVRVLSVPMIDLGNFSIQKFIFILHTRNNSAVAL